MNCLDNDIIIEDDEILFYFKYLKWDSDFFDTTAYVLDFEKSRLGVSLKVLEEIKSSFKNVFISCKANTNLSPEIINFLQEIGFRYIDTEVVLEYKSNNQNYSKSSKVIVEKYSKNENLPYEKLGSSFNLTRFHADTQIAEEKADLLWINYIKNYQPSEYSNMFIAKVDESVAGAVLVNVKDQTAYVFFVSILEEFQSLGVGTELMKIITQTFDDCVIRTGTQVKNVPALNFYIKNGFSKIYQTNTVLHYWS